MGAPIRVLCLPFRNGLHGGRVEATARAVATAVGYRRDPRTTLTGCGRHRHGFGCETLRVGSGKKARYLDWFQTGNRWLWKCADSFFGLFSEPFLNRLPWSLWSDGALQNFRRWHAVTGVRPASFLQQEQFEFFIWCTGFLSAAVDWNRGALQRGSVG